MDQYESVFTIFVPWTTNLKYLSWIGQYDYIEPWAMSTKLNFPQLHFGKFNFVDIPLGSIYSYCPLRGEVLNTRPTEVDWKPVGHDQFGLYLIPQNHLK